MAEDEKFEASRAMRRAMLGDAYVDAQTSDPNPVMREFSDYLTSMAWGVWTRGGALSTRDRSLVVLAMTAALGRMDEFRLHVSARSRTGVTDDELDELLFQIAAYCGAPAGVSARRAVLAERAAEQEGRLTVDAVGFVGLGNMGSVLAANLVGAGLEVVTHDVSGPDRNPEGAAFVGDVTQLAESVDVVVLSLPDGHASEQVARAIAGAPQPSAPCIIDTSTIGLTAAHAIDELLAAAGVGYVDAPVSGGVAGARARTLSVMYAGSDAACRAAEPVLAGLSDRRRRVGDTPGMAQALKLANNFLSATALAATSEAIAFGVSVGLDMGTMLEVIDASSGQSAATTDKFPNHVLTGRYGAGFANSLMAKDLKLYLGAVEEQGAPSVLGRTTESVWERVRGSRARSRLHPHLSVRRGPMTVAAALDGIRVLELGSFIAGPFAGQLLADLGAEVIKVESPGDGDPMRRWGTMLDGRSIWWSALARSKRLVALDLRQPEGRAVARRLARLLRRRPGELHPGATGGVGPRVRGAAAREPPHRDDEGLGVWTEWPEGSGARLRRDRRGHGWAAGAHRFPGPPAGPRRHLPG